MADLHWFPFFAKDWLSSPSVQRMTPEQRGAYIQLLAIAWSAAGPSLPSIPADDDSLAVMSGLGSRWKKVGGLVRAQFFQRDDLLLNAKLTDVWNEQQARHAKAVERARKGGKGKAASSRLQAPDKQASSVLATNHSSMDMVLENQKDSLPRGAGAPAPDGPRPAPAAETPTRDVRNPGGMTRLLDVLRPIIGPEAAT